MTPIPQMATEPDAAAADIPRAESIEELFHALESPLLAYAFRLTTDTDMAEDLVQEAFLRLHSQFAEVRQPRSWLYRTVHNLALNHRRDEAKVVPMTSPVDPEEGTPVVVVDSQPLPDEALARWEGIGLVRQNLQKLDARGQELIRLKFTEELSYQQISDRTGLGVGHVGYLLHHSLKSLAAALAKAGLVP